MKGVIMIESLLEQGLYQEALSYLQSPTNEQEAYQRLVCLYGLEMYARAKEEALVLKQHAKEYYYDVVSLLISTLQALEDYEEAINLLVEELSMPYIPYQYEVMFNEAYDTILLDKQDALMDHGKKASIFSEEDIETILEKPHHEDMLYMALEQLEGMNIRRFLPSVRLFLKNEEAPSLAKSLLLECLHQQEVDEELEVVKHGVLLEANPVYLPMVLESEAYDEISEWLARQLEDENPSLLVQCDQFLQYYLYDVYPRYIDFDEYALLAASIHYYVATLQSIPVDQDDLESRYQVTLEDVEEKILALGQLE